MRVAPRSLLIRSVGAMGEAGVIAQALRFGDGVVEPATGTVWYILEHQVLLLHGEKMRGSGKSALITSKSRSRGDGFGGSDSTVRISNPWGAIPKN